MEEVTKPGSVTKRPGHLLISKKTLRIYCGLPDYIYTLGRTLPFYENISDILKYTYVNNYKFHHVSSNGHIYYVDGNSQIWETDIKVPVNVIFNPVCVEITGDKKYRTVMFRKLTKLECLFM